MIYSKLSILHFVSGISRVEKSLNKMMVTSKQSTDAKSRVFKNRYINLGKGEKHYSSPPHKIQTKGQARNCAMSEVSTSKKGDLRDHAYSICRNYLSGSWKSISSSDMVFKSITGGLSNLIYYCSLPETHTPLVGEPKQALLRMYGQIHEGQRDVIESVIFMMLSERKLGPQLYGIFPGGRLEEYIQARAMTCEELRNPGLSATIARKLAAVHSLNVPIKKEPTWLYDTMTLWLSNIRTKLQLDSLDPTARAIAEKLLSHELEDELQWLWSFLCQVQSPVVFCHNDLQEGNILLPGDRSRGDDQVVFIDFEYCSYNFRGFDLANHFLEYCYDYQHNEHPYYSVHAENYPTEEQKLVFLRHYLSSSRVEGDETEGIEQRMLAEISCFTLASHFLWTLWAIHNAATSKIAFGYWEYGTDRLTAYYQHKERLLGQNRP